MQAVGWTGQIEAIAAHPLAELLDCPPSIHSLLDHAAISLSVEPGTAIFRQNDSCRGLYLVVSGLLERRTERMESRLNLGHARAGDLLELAAALGDGGHTYSLVAQSSATVLMLPIEALRRAFQGHPPLRMHLLEELAREVSRAYNSCSTGRTLRCRRRSFPAEA